MTTTRASMQRTASWRPITLLGVTRMLERGWNWTESPYGLAIRSPRGTVYHYRRGCLRRAINLNELN